MYCSETCDEVLSDVWGDDDIEGPEGWEDRHAIAPSIEHMDS